MNVTPSDVSDGSVHADAINCIAAYGVTIGMGDGTYAPDANVTADSEDGSDHGAHGEHCQPVGYQ